MINIAESLTLFMRFAASSCSGGEFFGLVPWYKYISIDGSCGVSYDFLIDGKNWPKLWLIAVAMLDDLLRIAGFVAVIFVIYGGFRYLTSQGEPENTRAAQSTILNALIGLAIAVIAASAVGFIGAKLGG